jgi:DNA-directed RNA polymerase specialized sigma24 family protein
MNMFEPEPPRISCRQLKDLLGNPEFLKIIELNTKVVARSWGIPYKAARGFVLSAVGEPEALASIHNAWAHAKPPGENLGLAKVIIRRRVIDLLRKDARQANHCSLLTTTDTMEAGNSLDSFDDLVQRNPRVQLELQQVIHMVRSAVACFAAQGQTQKRQAQLIRRYALEEAKYSELSVELACSENALRVRVHKAMLAFRRHIQVCHSELEDLLERDRRVAGRARTALAPMC